MIKFETGVSFRGVIKQHSGWYTAVREFQAVLVSKVLLWNSRHCFSAFPPAKQRFGVPNREGLELAVSGDRKVLESGLSLSPAAVCRSNETADYPAREKQSIERADGDNLSMEVISSR